MDLAAQGVIPLGGGTRLLAAPREVPNLLDLVGLGFSSLSVDDEEMILAIGTDGIWESQNARGQMFGKDRFRNVIGAHAKETAIEILQAVIDELNRFSRLLEKEDDVTLVVIKVE